MHYSNIETFLAIAETKSLSNAAERLYLAQSTVSYRLNSLEQEMGVRLIQRDKGKSAVSLTAKGEEFISIAKMWKSLLKNTDEWKTQQSLYKLKIGSVDSLNICVFSELYKKLLGKDSPLILNVGTHWTVTIHKFIENYETDVGFVLWEVPSESIVSKPLFMERMVLISSSASGFPDRIHPGDLNPKNEIYFYCGPNFKAWHDNWWGNTQKEISTVDTISLLKVFFDASDFWSIVPISVAKTLKKDISISISEIIDAPPERVCYQITNKHQLPRSKQSLEIFDEYLKGFIKSDFFTSITK